jgi:hypothetical protein
MLASTVAGLSCLAGCQSWMNSVAPSASGESETDAGDESLGLAYSKSRTSFPREDEAHSGWVHLVGGANVPNDRETLTVAVNDVEIQQIERSGTMPELRPLPDPVRPR